MEWIHSVEDQYCNTPDVGPGTELSHWDEEKFGAELMTGYENRVEHVYGTI